jgi:NADH:ubiquinone oxidoreductase subunit 3 (subunit A)
MKSSWDSYYVVFLSALLSLVIPASLAVISFLFFPKKKRTAQGLPAIPSKPNQTILGQRINVRFFLATNAALLLITLALELIPCVTSLTSENRQNLLSGLISIVTLASFAVLGLLYSVRKGDMGWLSSFHEDSEKKKG